MVELIRDLPALWSDPDARPEDRRALAEASFESVHVLGARRLAFAMAPPASGVQAVVMVGARGVRGVRLTFRAPRGVRMGVEVA